MHEIKKRIGLIYLLYTLYHTQIIYKEKTEKINITIGKLKKKKKLKNKIKNKKINKKINKNK